MLAYCKFHNNIPNKCQDFANLLLGHPVFSISSSDVKAYTEKSHSHSW